MFIYVLKVLLTFSFLTACIGTKISVQISHVETFEVGDYKEQDFVSVKDEALERTLQDELKFQSSIPVQQPSVKSNESANGHFSRHVKNREQTTQGESTDLNVSKNVDLSVTIPASENKRPGFDDTSASVSSVIQSIKSEKFHDDKALLHGKDFENEKNLSSGTNNSYDLRLYSEKLLSKTSYSKQRTGLVLADNEKKSFEKLFVNKIKPLSGKSSKIGNTLLEHNKSFSDKETNDLETELNDIASDESLIEKQIQPNNLHIDDTVTLRSLLGWEGGPQLERTPRMRRQVGIDVNEIAEQHFEEKTTSIPKSGDSFQVISAEDYKRANEEKRKRVLKYLGGTLLSVVCFSLIAYCFIKDPKGCIASFGTGCPCCILCLPCIRKCQEKMDPGPKIRENLNKYLPGVIIHDDGTVEAYSASPEEIEIVCDIIDEIIG